MGSLVSIFAARNLVLTFFGKGLVPDALAGTPEFSAAVGLGAVNRECRWKTVAGILGTWMTTLPAAAVFSGLLFLVLV